MPFSLFPSLALPGQRAPDFRLLDHQGLSQSLTDYRERHRGVILLFVASDFLPHDLKQLHRYIDAYPSLCREDIAVLALCGINWEKLHHLGKRLELPFPLLFDPCCRYARQYGAMWIPKFLNGRATFGILPSGDILFSARHAPPEIMIRQFQR